VIADPAGPTCVSYDLSNACDMHLMVSFDSIPDALEDLRSGKMVVVVDDESRENEGDLIGAAQFATPEMVNFMATEARGLICLAMTGERLDQLQLPLMVSANTDKNQTAFTVSIDAGPELGVSTGISASDRSKTILATINPLARPEQLRRPGHIFPLRARDGGVLQRAGHTEAAVDMARMAGLYPAGVICEIQNLDGTMARLPELIEYAQKYQLKIISIAELISYRLQNERLVLRETRAQLPTEYGLFEIFGYRSTLDNSEHVAIVRSRADAEAYAPFADSQESTLVRVHSECLTGDAFGSLRCDCRKQLQAALKMIDHLGEGVVVYLRQEGRGIGLVNKLKAYALQDMGLDTVEANERLGFAADLRNYGIGAQILNDLGVRKMKLITNNPRKIAGVSGYDLEITARVPLIVEETDFNARYLNTKALKLGHLLPQKPTHYVTVALSFVGEQTPNQRVSQVAQLRELADQSELTIREEDRLVARALFGAESIITHIGCSPKMEGAWYLDPQQKTYQKLASFLSQVSQWKGLTRMEFLVGGEQDPLAHLSERLDRKEQPLTSLKDYLNGALSEQIVYSFTI
jgi:3,4-dihydroxy 2-butanone 4-phosphate synthase / GTP cyclohydrolase II